MQEINTFHIILLWSVYDMETTATNPNFQKEHLQSAQLISSFLQLQRVIRRNVS